MANERNAGGQLVTGLVLLAVVLIGIYFATRGGNGDDNNNQDNQNQEQEQEQNPGNNPTPTPQPSGDNTDDDVQGNISATGTLRESDNAARGNYMVVGDRGTFYISTSRDYSSRVGQEVTLQANGSLNSYTFLGFSGVVADEGQDEDEDAGDVGGAPADDEGTDGKGEVTFTGRLSQSDNTARGNYMIVSGGTRVYLLTVHNYSSWLNENVVLTANGNLNSFTGARLDKAS